MAWCHPIGHLIKREGGERLLEGGDSIREATLVSLGGCRGYRAAENAWADLRSWSPYSAR